MTYHVGKVPALGVAVAVVDGNARPREPQARPRAQDVQEARDARDAADLGTKFPALFENTRTINTDKQIPA